MFQRAALAALLIIGAPAVHAQRRGGGGGGGLSGGSSGGSSGGINSSTDRTPTSSESSASCSISVDTRATSTAENAYADILVSSFDYLCTGQRPDGAIIAILQEKAKAVAEVMITFKTKCTATGDAWACGEAWAGASAFAAACYDIAIEAFAELDTSACDCSTDVFLSTFVNAEAIGSLLAGISAGSDVSACVEGSGDINPTEVDEVEVLKCTAESVAIITFGAVANAWVDGDCKQGFPAAICDNCCTETAGDATCDCEVCIEYQNERAGAFVLAFTDISSKGGAICTETITDVLTGAVETSVLEVPDEDFFSDNHVESGPGLAVCEVGAESDAYALAVNAHASASAEAIISACGGSITDAPRSFEDAAAIASVYQSAFASCFVVGDGASGCGYAESFGTAFAAACASASADAIAAITPEQCDCGGDLDAVATAYAEESTKIFAAVSQVVGANACVDDANPTAFSEIMRRCTTETYAVASASAVAKAWASAPECRPPPKKCVDKCQDAGEHKDVCIAGCSAEQWRSAEVSAMAHAQIDVESSTICSGSSVGDVWFADFGDGGEEQDLTAGAAVQATLRWSGDADLDLYVLTPDGETIAWFNPGPDGDGGTLEFDTIPDCGVPTLNVENTYWPAGATAGTYTAWAELYDNDYCDGALPIDFTLVLKIDGQTVETLPGSFSTNEGGQMSTKLTGTL